MSKKTLLRIDASARVSRSLTRALADQFIRSWRRIRATDELIHRDVGLHPPSSICERWIAAAFAETPSLDHRIVLEESDLLISELRRSHLIVLATPMYNYGMPASLKAWLDQVIRLDQTFSFDLARGDRPLAPTMSGKTLVLLTSCGEFGFGIGEINEGADHLTPHLRTVSRYLGVEQIHHVGIEYQEFGDQRFDASKRAAEASVGALVERLACS